ncbi:MAG: hypothetical protein AAF433_06485 [Bacteroidota bacterium]
MPSPVSTNRTEEQQQLLNYRPRSFWVRLASAWTTTYLLSKRKRRTAAVGELDDTINFFFEKRASKGDFKSTSDEILSFLALIGLLVAGFYYTFFYENRKEFVLGFLGFAISVFILGAKVASGRTVLSSYRFCLTKESLVLPGTGEFLWQHIAEIAIKERFGKMRVLLMLLSDGTIVEHEVKRFNSSYPQRPVIRQSRELRQLIHEYWMQGQDVS